MLPLISKIAPDFHFAFNSKNQDRNSKRNFIIVNNVRKTSFFLSQKHNKSSLNNVVFIATLVILCLDLLNNFNVWVNFVK